MSAITLDLPLDGLSHLNLREGQPVSGCIRDGKLHVTIPLEEDGLGRSNASVAFLEKWSGKGEVLSESEILEDPRLTTLTEKHLR